MVIDISSLLTVIGWVGSLMFFLVMANITLVMWMSRRELDRNEVHKRDMEHSNQKYLALHLDVIQEKIKFTQMMVDKNDEKSGVADAEIKGMWEKSNSNERELYQRDEAAGRIIAEKFSELKSEMAKLGVHVGK